MAQKDRESKSDRGILTLVTNTLTDGLGLSADTADRVMKIIRQRGELAAVKQHIRKLSGATHKRFNQMLDLADEDMKRNKDKPEADPEMDGKKNEKKMDDKPAKKEKAMTEGKLTFMAHLVNEMQDMDQGSDMEDMDADTMMKMARMKKSNPDLAKKKQLLMLRKQMAKEQDPLKKRSLKARIDKMRSGDE